MIEYFEITVNFFIAIVFLAVIFYKILEYHKGDETFNWLIIFLLSFGFISALSITRALELYAGILSK